MSEYRYHARILPDGHLPVPEGTPVQIGDEVDVVITPRPDANGGAEVENRRRAQRLLTRWAGVFRSGKGDVAERHDDYLYGGGYRSKRAE